MQTDFQGMFQTEKPLVFGRSRRGNDLEEYQWGSKEKSILFLSGFTSEDRPLSQLLLRWKSNLAEEERYGGILGDFDLKTLKNKCKIRVIPILNPDAYEINQNGLSKNYSFDKKPLETNEKMPNSNIIRTNFRGVDLNRNFNSNWIKMRNENPQRNDIGTFPESETETAALTARLRKDLPRSAVILRYGERGLHYPKEATEKEIREAVFLGHYASLSVSPAAETDGTALQWLTDRGVKVIEVFLPGADPKQYPKLRDLLTMCAALS